jgi:hypothetical protein
MMKVLTTLFFFTALACKSQTNGFFLQWQHPNDRLPLLYEVCHGTARGTFSVHPHPTDQTNIFVPNSALWNGDNWFAVTAVDTATNRADYRETDFSDWIVIRKIPAIVLSGSDAFQSTTNLKDWVDLTNNEPIPMIQARQFFRAVHAGTITAQQSAIFKVDNSP